MIYYISLQIYKKYIGTTNANLEFYHINTTNLE